MFQCIDQLLGDLSQKNKARQSHTVDTVNMKVRLFFSCCFSGKTEVRVFLRTCSSGGMLGLENLLGLELHFYLSLWVCSLWIYSHLLLLFGFV